VHELTKTIAATVIEKAEPMIKVLMDHGWTEHRRGIWVVIRTFDETGETEWQIEKVIGNPDDRHDYLAIANSKADISMEHRKPSHEVPLMDRQAGDTIYYGSTHNVEYAFVVGVSGFQAYFDRLACQIIEALIIDELGDPTELAAPDFVKAAEAKGDFLTE
jgi:hypothetical protein